MSGNYSASFIPRTGTKMQPWYVCNPSTGEAETGVSLGHRASQPCLFCELQAKDDLASKWVGSVPKDDPEFVLWLYSHGFYL